MADFFELLKRKAREQYAKGQPYRDLMFRGDPTGVIENIKEFNQKAQAPEGAFDVALNVNPMLTFIGKGSKLWNSDLAKQAVELEKKGIAPEEIWRQTGTLRAPDGELRQEISDIGAKITDNVYEGIKSKKKYFGKMKDALEHPELYKAYPKSKNVDAIMYAAPEPSGSFWQNTNEIMVGAPGTTSQKSVALHELQHWIQGKENWAKGGSPENVMEYASKYNIDPHAAYRRLAGEAEARLTQRRMNLTPEQRRKYYPWSNTTMGEYGLDVPYNELIIRGLLD